MRSWPTSCYRTGCKGQLRQRPGCPASVEQLSHEPSRPRTCLPSATKPQIQLTTAWPDVVPLEGEAGDDGLGNGFGGRPSVDFHRRRAERRGRLCFLWMGNGSPSRFLILLLALLPTNRNFLSVLTNTKRNDSPPGWHKLLVCSSCAPSQTVVNSFPTTFYL
jgi:hypothetical protein